MQVLYRTCCGLDVHKQTIVACLISLPNNGQAKKEVRSFEAVTDGLLALAEWLRQAGCKHVAMEGTGVYWKPVYNILEGDFEVTVLNAAHLKKLPGRKTDVQDAEWIADLFQHGMVRASFIPDRAQRDLRDLTRTRTKLIDEHTAVVNRLQKVLEDANIKVAGVATDIMGVSGRAMIEAILTGTTDAQTLAELAKGKLRKKREQLERALTGRVSEHHRLLLGMHLEHIDFLDESIARLSAEIAERLRPFQDDIDRLDTIPGVGRETAEVIVAEVGLDMSQFPDAAHLASWAGMCPGNTQSAGKRKGGKTRKGSKALRRALVQAATAAGRKKGSYFQSRYQQLRVRRGAKKAKVAIGHTILTTAYYLLTRKECYHEPSPVHLDERRRARVRQRALDQLDKLGYRVTLASKEDAA